MIDFDADTMSEIEWLFRLFTPDEADPPVMLFDTRAELLAFHKRVAQQARGKHPHDIDAVAALIQRVNENVGVLERAH